MIKFFDCFSGIGGFRSGLEQAGGFECVAYCEIDKYAAAAYRAMYNTEGEFFQDTLQVEPPEYELIQFSQRGVCLYKCGNERFCLCVKAPEHKAVLFGLAGGR